MTNEQFVELIKNSFLMSIQMAKDVKPLTPEWDFVWGILDLCKEYYEESERNKHISEEENS